MAMRKSGTPPEKIFKIFTGEAVKNADGRSYTFTVSTGSVDRERDVLSPDGWVLDAYKRNPTVLFAQQVRELVDQGFLRSTSVGFRPITWSYDKARGGFDFHEMELLEISIVPVPANSEALLGAGMKAFSPMRRWAENVLAKFPGEDAVLRVVGGEAPAAPVRSRIEAAEIVRQAVHAEVRRLRGRLD